MDAGLCMRRFERPCMFCGGTATMLAPEGSTALDVDAEFAAAGRSFSDVPDGDPIGVGCHACSRKQWRKLGDYYACCGEFGGCGGPCAAFPCWELTT
jgi:hypothetical protein